MIKLRLSGKSDEIEKALIIIRQMKHWEVLNESGDYFDRAPSKYVRRYVDIDLVETPENPAYIKVDPSTGEVLR